MKTNKAHIPNRSTKVVGRAVLFRDDNVWAINPQPGLWPVVIDVKDLYHFTDSVGEITGWATLSHYGNWTVVHLDSYTGEADEWRRFAHTTWENDIFEFIEDIENTL